MLQMMKQQNKWKKDPDESKCVVGNISECSHELNIRIKDDVFDILSQNQSLNKSTFFRQ